VSALSFDSTDLAETEHFLSSAYTPMRITGRAESTRAVVSRQSARSLSIDDVSFEYDMEHVTEAPIGKVCLCIVRSGQISRRWFPEGSAGRFGAGDAFVYAPHDRPVAGVVRSATHSLIMFDPALFDQVVTPSEGHSPRPVLARDQPVSSAAARHFRAVTGFLRTHILSVPAARDEPLTIAAASHLLAATVLSTFPTFSPIGDTVTDRRDGNTMTLRRAIAFIDAHAHEPIGLADIAAASGVTHRALQVAFRRHRDTTPMAFLRQVRLDAAHRDLGAAAPGSAVTVASVAARWGFGPAARFSVQYCDAYGELPSETLARDGARATRATTSSSAEATASAAPRH
jgi:AraC-like DNA-binding protein